MGKWCPICLARIPDSVASFAATWRPVVPGRGAAAQLTATCWIAEQIAPTLSRAAGLMFVGLDVIGDYLTEINVTSPTCAREIDDARGHGYREPAYGGN